MFVMNCIQSVPLSVAVCPATLHVTFHYGPWPGQCTVELPTVLSIATVGSTVLLAAVITYSIVTSGVAVLPLGIVTYH